MKNVAILALAAVAIIGFAYFAIFSTPANELASEAESTINELSSESASVPAVPESRKGNGTLESLRLLNEDLECEITYTNDEQRSKVAGTYFVSEGSMRGDFLTESPDLSGQILSSMIIDNGLMYIWSEIEGEQYGIKVELSATGQPDVQSREPVSMNDEVEYNCKSWKNVDRTVFIPPATVLFQDMNQLIKNGMEYGNIFEEGDALPQMMQ
jgi:hypothetical protein